MAEDSDEKKQDKSWWGDAVKELTSAGLATLLMTEDSIRSYLKEKKLPKELVALLLDGAQKKKNDLYAVIAKEVGSFLGKMDLGKEIATFLLNHKIHVKGTVQFEPKKKE